MAINNKKGFTLVEMLIVIVIIGILAAALIPRLTGAQAQARDTARLADLNQLGTALAVYQGNNGTYPPVTWQFIEIDLAELVNSYIKSLPKDPQATRTVALCHPAAPEIDGYTRLYQTSMGPTPGHYNYSTIDNGKNFVLAANTEVLKKGNRIPEDNGNSGCIKDDFDATWSFMTSPSTLSEINANMVTSNTMGNPVDTIYIYAN